MWRSSLAVSLGTGVGTLVCVGGATLLVSSAGLHAVKAVVKHRQAKRLVACQPCRATGYRSCDICHGEKLMLCRAPVSARSLKQQQAQSAAAQPEAQVLCVCPACGSTAKQRCLNCLGTGKALPEEAGVASA
ncbi:hypothetical protein ACKKBG_A38515 [Auxenochlorella protothecoides x Auxenochlorella symbiontica]